MNDARDPAVKDAKDTPAPVGLVNIANVLTVVRILLVPVFVVCLVHGGTAWRLAALAAFAAASVTDFLDGQLARKRGLVTDFGKIADPIADKALTGAALITLTASQPNQPIGGSLMQVTAADGDPALTDLHLPLVASAPSWADNVYLLNDVKSIGYGITVPGRPLEWR